MSFLEVDWRAFKLFLIILAIDFIQSLLVLLIFKVPVFNRSNLIILFVTSFALALIIDKLILGKK